MLNEYKFYVLCEIQLFFTDGGRAYVQKGQNSLTKFTTPGDPSRKPKKYDHGQSKETSCMSLTNGQHQGRSITIIT